MMEEVTPRLRRMLFVVSLPFALGLMLSLVLQSRILPDPVLVGQLTADLGTLMFLAGLALSGVGWMSTIVSWYWLRRTRQLLFDEHQRQEEEHRRFIHRLDHELKNPLATLQLSLTNLTQEMNLLEHQSNTLQVANGQIQRLAQLVQDLRKLANLETYPIEPEAISLTDLLQVVITAVRDTSNQPERLVSVIAPQVPWPPTPVIGDSDLLTLAFYNLLNNAFKYTSPNNDIEILIHEDGTTVTVDVADSGSGIGEADLPHIFEELYRGENAGPVEGSGLGLALAKKIIERHNGKITVRSRIGQGTVFTVRLPVSLDKRGRC